MNHPTHAYRVTRVLGHGGFGSVYLAEVQGRGLARQVAIKVLHRDAAEVPALVARLRDEARVLSLVRHRAIVRVDDLVQLDGAWSIVMEYVEGVDVSRLIRAARIPAKAALEIASEVAYALHAASSGSGPDGRPLGLIHRDVKPANILVTASGEVKLLDFGVARADFTGRESATTRGTFGTVQYMAPERFQGEDRPAGDVYALGVTLFQAILGVPPGGHAMDADRRPPGKSLVAEWAWLGDAHPELCALLCRMLAADGEERPTAREVARQLEWIRERTEGPTLREWAEDAVPEARALPAAPAEPGTLTLAVGSVLRSEPEPVVPPPARSPWWLAGGAAAGAASLFLVMVLGVGGALWWASRAPTAAPAAPPDPSAAPAVISPPNGSVSAVAPVPVAAAPVAPVPVTPVPVASTVAPASVAPPPAKVPPAKAEPSAAPVVASPEPALPKQKVEAAKTETTKTGGRLAVVGDAKVSLSGTAGTFGPGPVPEGEYVASARFPDGVAITVRRVRVSAGGTTTLDCDATFQTCSVR